MRSEKVVYDRESSRPIEPFEFGADLVLEQLDA